MKGLCILCLAISKTKTVFDVVDGAFDRCADLIGRLPFFCSPDHSGTAAEIFLRIKINHASAFRIRAGIFTMADAVVMTIFAFTP